MKWRENAIEVGISQLENPVEGLSFKASEKGLKKNGKNERKEIWRLDVEMPTLL